MKVKIIKPCKFSFRPCDPIAHFNLGEIHDLPKSQAERLIECNYAVSVESEKKMYKVEKENKMFNVKHVENKAEDSKNKVNVKHEVKPKKGKKSK